MAFAVPNIYNFRYTPSYVKKTYNDNLLFVTKEPTNRRITNVKYIPYIPRKNVSKNYSRLGTRIKMKENKISRRVLLLIYLLSFVPYLLPNDEKPVMYQFKTQEELEILKRDIFIGGKIENLPFL